MRTMEGATRANSGCEEKQWQVLLWPLREKVSQRAAYVVSSTSLQRTQPPTIKAAPKVGARKPGLQRDQGDGREKRLAGALDRERWGGKGFIFPLLGKEKAKLQGPSRKVICLIHCTLQSPGQDLTHGK